jgi:hypothetical protein
MAAAKSSGAIVSYDLNYRSSLWNSIGGKPEAQRVNRMLAPLIDVMLGNEEDFTAALGFSVAGLDEHHSQLDTSNFEKMMEQVVREFPNLKVVATTLRNAKTSTRNDWGAVCSWRPVGGRMRNGARRARHDYAGRHIHGHAGRGAAGNEIEYRSYHSLTGRIQHDH